MNRFSADKAVHNFRNIRGSDAPIEKVIGFDQNRYAGGALIETARGADARFEFCESTRGELLFQRSIHFFRALGGAASFRVGLVPTIDTDKEIALALQRG